MSKPATSESTSGDSPGQIAQQAIMFIAKARLQPVPSVFEVWYRHFEGANQSLSDELSFRMDEPTSVTMELVESLYQQHCSPSGTDEDMGLTVCLADFRSMLTDQHDAGRDFAEKLDAGGEALATATPSDAANVAGQLSRDTVSMQAKIDQMQQRVEQAERKAAVLQEQLRKSQTVMMTDHLTGVGNRRFYDAVLGQMVNAVDDTMGTAYLVLVDCDKFKRINDNFGHPIGDELIKTLAKIMQSIDANASVARLGGDEFAIFLRCQSVGGIEEYADALRTEFSKQRIINSKTNEEITRMTLSMGVAAIRGSDDVSSWHDRADRLLYEAKRLGGDRSVIEKLSAGS